MAFQVITDMEYADKLWEAGLLYYKDDGRWVPDTYYTRSQLCGVDWRPSADDDREGQQNEYAIYVED